MAPNLSLRGTSGFVVTLRTAVPPAEALRRVLDLEAHTRVIPFTRVIMQGGPQAEQGERFVARTGLLGLSFDDPMHVKCRDEHGAVIVKEGSVITGTITVTADGTDEGSVLRWRQRFRLPWLPSLLQHAAAPILRFGYRRALQRLLRG